MAPLCILALFLDRKNHHMQLVHDNTAQRGEATLLRHSVDQAVGLLNGADHHSGVGLQHPSTALATIVPLHLPAEVTGSLYH